MMAEKKYPVKEYIVWRCPDGTILFDWDGNTWKYGYPFYPKSRCVELERGMCEGGPNIPQMAARMREKYGPGAQHATQEGGTSL